ncbi:MAG: pantoate--beta-alanine ligase [Chloroflexi bacterium]|nr:pantoate--beta-alanine ligase [Chloroflexota bacterium]
MWVSQSVAELQGSLRSCWKSSTSIGLVPTMGALHEGHRSLVRRARNDNDVTICSIFVNPTQFGPNEDFTRYPRALERDLALLEAESVAGVFVPTPVDMYPSGFDTRIDVGELGRIIEGARRPGHFSGVATVVTKLFNLTRPSRAYFGQKDAQQLAVIRQITRDLNIPVEVIGCPTVREPDGLALSSRNMYLSPSERLAATVLFRALNAGRDAYRQGERTNAQVRDAVTVVVQSERLAVLDYAEVVDPDSFSSDDPCTDRSIIVIAARVGTTRLIDNLTVSAEYEHQGPRTLHRQQRTGTLPSQL